MGGTHVISVLATGGPNESPKKASANITYSAPTSAPKFGAPGAANVLTSSALLLGEIELSGASSNTVDFVWDTSDKAPPTFPTGMVLLSQWAQVRKGFTANRFRISASIPPTTTEIGQRWLLDPWI